MSVLMLSIPYENSREEQLIATWIRHLGQNPDLRTTNFQFMQFLYPSFLIALLVLAIPIILHLFYFRRFKKVYFTNVRFLKEVKDESSARSNLKHLLVLLSRLLALLFLVLAFAQPFIPEENATVKQGQKAVSIFVDNSFSMQAESQDVPLIEKAKQRAREIISAYEVTDEFQVLTNDFEGRHQQLVSQEDALAFIDEITISPEVKSLAQVYSRQTQTLEKESSENQYLYMISDFQKSIVDIDIAPDTLIDRNFIPLQAVQERNISIDSAWFESPVQTVQQTNRMLVKISNHSGVEAESIRLAIDQDGQNKPIGTFNIPAQSSIVDTVNISLQRPGWHEAILKITDYPVTFDDAYFTSFYVADRVNILVLNDEQPNRFLNAAISGLPIFQLVNQNVNAIDYAALKNFQLVIVNELRNISSGLSFELQQYVRGGGNLLVFPSELSNLESYRSFLGGFPANELMQFERVRREVGSINTEEFIFNDVFESISSNVKLPASQGNFTLTDFGNRGEEVILAYRNGKTYLGKYQIDQGHLYLCAAPLNEEQNNLVQNGEIFIPLLYKAAISSGKDKNIAFTIGKDEVIEVNHLQREGEMVYKVKGQNEEFIPRQRIVLSKALLNMGDQIREAGYYEVFLAENNPIEKLAFNFDRQESDLSYYASDDLSKVSQGAFNVIDLADNAILTASIEARRQGTVLWKWCIILMLIFLGIETLLLRFWKT